MISKRYLRSSRITGDDYTSYAEEAIFEYAFRLRAKFVLEAKTEKLHNALYVRIEFKNGFHADFRVNKKLSGYCHDFVISLLITPMRRF